MQQEFPANLEPVTRSNQPSSTHSTQHGLLHRDSSGLGRDRLQGSSDASPRSASAVRRDASNGVNADQLDEKLRGLSSGSPSRNQIPVPGQRISDYENALTPPTPRHALGFKVIKRSDGQNDGMQLTDFPNGSYSLLLWLFKSLTGNRRDLDAYPLSFAPGFPRCGFTRLQTLLRARYDLTCLENGVLALLPRPGGTQPQGPQDFW